MKRKGIILALILISCIVLSSYAKDPEIIKVGLTSELTGAIPKNGKSCRDAADLAVKEINDAGGLLVGGQKYKIQLFVEDNEDKADVAASVAQKLIAQRGVLAVIGPNASRNAVPTSEVCESAKTPMITTWSTNPKTTINSRTGQPKKYVFRACFIDDFQGAVVARFVKDSLKVTKAAVLYDIASEYNKGISDVFKKVFVGLGGQVVAFESYTTGDKDFSAQLTKIKEAKPDVIFLPNYYSEVPLQVQQARKLGITASFVGSDTWATPELLKLAGKEIEGCYFTGHYAPDIATPKAKKFIAAYQAQYGEVPDDVAALTYDAFGLLFQAIQRAGKIDSREAVRNALANTPQYDGVTGTITFKEGSGDPIKTAVIIQIKDGQFKYFSSVAP